jgi:hypothetical protein
MIHPSYSTPTLNLNDLLVHLPSVDFVGFSFNAVFISSVVELELGLLVAL